MNKKYIYIALGLIAIIIISLYIGRNIGKKDQKDQQIRQTIKVIKIEDKNTVKKIDSLQNVIVNLSDKTEKIKKKETSLREKAKDIVVQKPINTTECDELFTNATKKINLLEETIIQKDTIESNLISIINNKDNIILNKDKLIANKELELKLTKELSKPRDKKFSISIQVGYGAAVTTQNNTVTFKTVPYIGIGVSRALFSF